MTITKREATVSIIIQAIIISMTIAIATISLRIPFQVRDSFLETFGENSVLKINTTSQFFTVKTNVTVSVRYVAIAFAVATNTGLLAWLFVKVCRNQHILPEDTDKLPDGIHTACALGTPGLIIVFIFLIALGFVVGVQFDPYELDCSLALASTNSSLVVYGC